MPPPAPSRFFFSRLTALGLFNANIHLWNTHSSTAAVSFTQNLRFPSFPEARTFANPWVCRMQAAREKQQHDVYGAQQRLSTPTSMWKPPVIIHSCISSELSLSEHARPSLFSTASISLGAEVHRRCCCPKRTHPKPCLCEISLVDYRTNPRKRCCTYVLVSTFRLDLYS